ncbi:hypothetical protein BVX95_01490, partial [archaeon D22]
IGKAGQKRISDTTVSIVGCGALGSNSAEIMARAGVKKIILIDGDKVEESNLQRQAMYTKKDVGSYKVEALKEHILSVRDDIEVEIHKEFLAENNVDLIKSDMILDGLDNLKTRFMINEFAKKKNIPYVFGATIKSEGMVYSVLPKRPCFECVFKNSKDFESCESQGILASAAKTVASIQCVEAIKIIMGEKFRPNLIKFNLWDNNFLSLKTKFNSNCSICNKKETKLPSFEIKECETKAMYRVKLKERKHLDMSKLQDFEVVMDGGMIVIVSIDGHEVIVHDYGELIFKELKDTEKIREVSQTIYGKIIP